MTFFYTPAPNVLEITHCNTCNKMYTPVKGMENVSCCVMHGEGSCCHYSEREVTEEQLTQVRTILFGEDI